MVQSVQFYLTSHKILKKILSHRLLYSDIHPLCLHNDASSDAWHRPTASIYFLLYNLFTDRNSVVGIPMDYGLKGQESIRGKVKSFFLLFTASRPALGPAQPPIQWVPGALSSRVNRSEREVDHSPPSSAKVKIGGAIPPLLHIHSRHNA
jgi:hypothetical protein